MAPGFGWLGDLIQPKCFDADTTAAERAQIQLCSNIILTNPDILHATLLPMHRNWHRFMLLPLLYSWLLSFFSFFPSISRHHASLSILISESNNKLVYILWSMVFDSEFVVPICSKTLYLFNFIYLYIFGVIFVSFLPIFEIAGVSYLQKMFSVSVNDFFFSFSLCQFILLCLEWLFCLSLFYFLLICSNCNSSLIFSIISISAIYI